MRDLPIREVYHALENAAVDLYGFSIVCRGGAAWMGEPDLLDTLLLALENSWITENEHRLLSHMEFREEIFHMLWAKGRARQATVRVGEDVPLGHEEMAFYQLPIMVRAALYLRTKKKFSYDAIGRILGLGEGVVREEIERGREFLLGRRLSEFEWTEEKF